MSNVISEVIAGLEAGWNTSVTALPKITDGGRETNTRRKRHKYKNVVFVYDNGARFDLIEPTHTYKDGNYNIRLEIESTQSESKRDSIGSECVRIIGQTGITNYDNKRVMVDRKFGNTSKWQENIIFNITKYNEII